MWHNNVNRFILNVTYVNIFVLTGTDVHWWWKFVAEGGWLVIKPCYRWKVPLEADILSLVCVYKCEFVTFPLVSWVRCGTWLYRFLIFAPLLTLYMSSRLLSFYSILPYNADLDITQSCCGSQFFYHGILQRNYRKMTIKWSFSYNSFVKFPIITWYTYNTVHFYGHQRDCTVFGLSACIYLEIYYYNFAWKSRLWAEKDLMRLCICTCMPETSPITKISCGTNFISSLIYFTISRLAICRSKIQMKCVLS